MDHRYLNEFYIDVLSLKCNAIPQDLNLLSACNCTSGWHG